MMDKEQKRQLKAHDPDFKKGAVEDGKRDMIDKQLLPVWASTEPFGYEGSPSDAQAVGGEVPGAWPAERPGEAAAERDVIGPAGD